MPRAIDRNAFANHLRAALISLYDPRVLQNSVLVSTLNLADKPHASGALRRVLCDAIESLRPEHSTPAGSRIWRTYQILRRRYTEQLTQQAVASDLGLSVRQLQREDKAARDALADYLWRTYSLEQQAIVDSDTATKQSTEATQAPIPTRDEELAWLEKKVPAIEVNLHGTLNEVIRTLTPLSAVNQVVVDYEPGEGVPPLWLSAPMLRQALLNVLSVAMRAAQGGRIQIHPEPLSEQVVVHITAIPEPQRGAFDIGPYAESLDMAERLIALCQGELSINTTVGDEVTDHSTQRVERLVTTLSLPLARQNTVLVVDDNADVLHLFQRYLQGTRFRFVGTEDAQGGLALAQQLHPNVVVLDVMMPGRDGWTLLSQLREHPETEEIPIVVCTILAQGELALVLGAADFIRKPVSRAALLEVLNRQVTWRPTSPG